MRQTSQVQPKHMPPFTSIRLLACLLLVAAAEPVVVPEAAAALTGQLFPAGQQNEAALQPVHRPYELQRHFHRAKTAFESGSSLLEAKARIDRVLKVLPDDVEARKLRAHVLLTMDRPEDAFADAQRAVALNEFDGEAHVLRCESGVGAGQHEWAARSLDRAAHFMLRDAGLYVRLSACALELGDTTKSEALARVAVAREPDNPQARLHLARVFVAAGQNDMAARVVLEGFEKRILRPADIRRNVHVAPLMDRPDLAPWRRR